MRFEAKSDRILCVADADIAQSVERILGKDEVASSNLAISSSRNHLYGIACRGDFLCIARFLRVGFEIWLKKRLTEIILYSIIRYGRF